MPPSAHPVRDDGPPVANNWYTYDTTEIFHWEAQLPWSLGSTALLAWQDALLDAGERHRIFRIESAEPLGYRRERDGFIGDYLREHGGRIPPEYDRYPPGFLLGKADAYVPSTLLEYAADGRIAQAWVTDMADLALLAGVRIAGSQRPVSVDADPGYEDFGEDYVWANISLSSDIWFPWNGPRSGGPYDEPIDNRLLARRNSTRLNAFLRDVRQATLDLGGAWAAAEYKASPLRPADEYGIVLPDDQ